MMSVLPTRVSADLSAMIAQVAADKENTKMEISTLRRDMDLYRRQARNLLSQGYSADSFQKFQGYFKNFTQDVGCRVGDMCESVNSGNDESYHVLRGSLSDAQKRCENLNENMLKVADANGDLLHTLGSLKNANKRLVDQLEQQSGELTNLEQQAVLGEEKLMNTQSMQEEDMDRWRSEAQFRLDDYAQIQQDHYDNMASTNTKKVRNSLEDLNQILGKVDKLRVEREDLREDSVAQTDKISKHWASMLQYITKEMGNLGDTRRSETQNLQDTVHSLSVKLDTERELHDTDVSQWKTRVKSAKRDRDETHAHLESTEDALRMEFQRLEALGEASHLASQETCKELSFRSEELSGHIASLTTMIEIAKCKTTQLNNRCEALKKDNITSDENIARLRSEFLDADSCLQDAIVNYEQLSEQMDQMRTDAQQENEQDLSQCKELYDRKMEIQRSSHGAQTTFQNEESSRLANAITKETSEEKMWANKVDSQCHQRTLLQRGCEMWKQHYDDAVKTAQKTSDEYKQSKLQWDQTFRSIDEARNESISINQTVQQRLQQASEEFLAYQESSKERIRAESHRAENLQQDYVEAESAEDETTKSLKETTNRLQLTTCENARGQSASLQRQTDLRREADIITKQTEEIRKTYEDAMMQEKKAAERLNAEFYKLREENAFEVNRWSEIPQAQIQAMEREIDEMTSRDKAELAQLNSQNQATIRELGSLSDEYRRQSGLLDEQSFQFDQDAQGAERRSTAIPDNTPPKVSMSRMTYLQPKV